jgi:hypothetical protein
MAFHAPCGCPSEGDERVRMTAHLPGCRFLEDLFERSCCPTSAHESAAEREPSAVERALQASYEKYADQLAEIEALRSGRR